MKFGRTEAIIVIIILLSFAIGFYYYPQLPARMASHWNAQGQVDGYMSKIWGVFLMPVISIGLALLLVLLPRIDPLKANIEQFKKYYDWFVIIILLFMLYIHLLTIIWNLGTRFNLLQLMVPAFAILIYSIGVMVQKTKRNYFIGIRTPWTLNSDKVWEKTHLVGGKLFKAAGMITLLGVFFPGHAIYLLLVPVIVAALFSVVYSYIEYRKVCPSG